MTVRVNFCLGSQVSFIGNPRAVLGYTQEYAVKRKMTVIAEVKKPSATVKTK